MFMNFIKFEHITWGRQSVSLNFAHICRPRSQSLFPGLGAGWEAREKALKTRLHICKKLFKAEFQPDFLQR